MSTSQRKNLKIPGEDFAFLERAAAEDGAPSATAYVRKLIAADRWARARREAEAMLAEVYRRHPADASPSDTEFLRTAADLYEFMTGEAPTLPPGVGTRKAARLVLAQIAARAVVDGAEQEYRTGDELALGAFMTTLVHDPRVTVDRVGAAAGALANVLTHLIDLLGDRELVEASH